MRISNHYSDGRDRAGRCPLRQHVSNLWLLLIAILLPVLVAAGQTPEKKATSQQSSPTSSLRGADPSQFVGSETCRSCHEDMFRQWSRNAHAKGAVAHKGAGFEGCESCHGPGQAHVEGGGDKSQIFSFKDAKPKEATERCLDCHAQAQEHAGFSRSKHARADVGCSDCHSVHTAKAEGLLKQESPQLCYSCHTDVKPQFARPFKHRVNEGLIACNDCHNPHGSNQPRQVRRSGSADAVCFTCHADKQGPFVFEHAPVKAEGCSSCHTPHGSTTPRMLNRPAVNLLCLECHSPSFAAVAPTPAGPAHNQNTRYQACTVCHSFIHGSNSSEVFFKP
jgi:DmsE family decaheme c-type cytochrome